MDGWILVLDTGQTHFCWYLLCFQPRECPCERGQAEVQFAPVALPPEQVLQSCHLGKVEQKTAKKPVLFSFFEQYIVSIVKERQEIK